MVFKDVWHFGTLSLVAPVIHHTNSRARRASCDTKMIPVFEKSASPFNSWNSGVRSDTQTQHVDFVIQGRVPLFLYTLEKMWKVTVSFTKSVRKLQLASHWTDFREILHLSIFRKSVEIIQAPLKYDKNKRYFTRRRIYIYDHISLSSS